MLRFLPSAIDDALDTLYSQFLGSASMTFFSLSLLLLPLLVLSFLAFLVFLFPFLFRFFASLSFLSFPLPSFLFFIYFPN